MWNGRDLNPKRGFENGQRPFRQSAKRLCPEGVEGQRPGINPSLSADDKKLPAYRRLFLLLSFEMWNGRDLNPKRGFENGQRPFPESAKRLCPEGSFNNNRTIACRTPG